MMHKINKLRYILVLFLIFAAFFVVTPMAQAATPGKGFDCQPVNGSAQSSLSGSKPAINCQNDKALESCTSTSSQDGGCGLINTYIQPLINVLAGAVGLIATISIIVGGIQYSSAGGDAQKVMAARQRITNAVLALITFGLLYAFLQWLIPGGLIP